ncbi:macrophage mannose receptor 1-like [Ptychodera flava]|uniref:macrophage mannose receptor 1-like n=1 Tax=Ptychodera flava TaxID=63121 RepID=UPI00396A9CEE
MVDADDRLPWADALDDCKKRGADLASFHSDDELRYVKTNSRVINFIEEFWIGLNDRDAENGFVWTDGTPVNFVMWDEGEPNDNGGDEDCVEMTFAAPKGWNDRNCARNKNWVCKMPKFVSPFTSFAPATHTKSINCGSDADWVYSMGACYYFSDPDSDGRLSWPDSRDWCLSKAGDLVSVHSAMEQQFIYTQMRDKQMITSWIGLREYSSSGTHMWSDGTPVDYVNWDEGQPDDAYGQEKCVELRTTDGEWNDLNCGDIHTFVCKKLTTDTKPKTAEPTSLPSGYCPVGFMEYKSKCYSFNGGEGTELLDWTSAVNKCGTYGGNLVSIHSQEIQSFLTSNLRDYTYSMWIGLSDTLTKKKYRWQDGSEVDYTNWAQGEPNGERDNQEHCVEMHFGGYGGKWNDANCDNKLGYSCETLKSPSNPPPTVAPNKCRAGYTHYWNGCYKLLTGSYTWQAARESCTQDQADLVSIEDIYEQAYIETYMYSANKPLWIGFNDVDQAGTYSWSDGSPVFYTKWGNGEPSVITGEGCVQLGTDGGWDDTTCSLMTNAVCKYYLGNKPTTPAPVAGSCNFGNQTTWKEYHKYCYNMDGAKDAKSWAEASYECDKIGGYVVTIDDADEQNYIENIIYENSLNIWLGLVRTDLGGFEWVDGSPLDYTKWNEGEPNNYDNIEDCVELYYYTKNWNDVSCYNSAGYICKRQKAYERTMPPDGSNPGSQSGGLSGGAVFGIILGVVLAIVAAGAVIYVVFIRGGLDLFSSKKMADTNPSVGFDNTLYSTSPSVGIDDKVKLDFNDSA